MSKMTAYELVNKALEIEKQKTVYAWGTFGWPLTREKVDRVAKQYPNFYNASRKANLYGLVGSNTYMFDCVGLIKGILWGWDGNKSKTYGGATYNSNSVPDVDANVMLAYCDGGGSSDWSKIEAGECVWLPGHIGIYVGNGKVVEATTGWNNKVQLTYVGNRIQGTPTPPAGAKVRTWSKHGKIPYVDYSKTSAKDPSAPQGAKIDAGDIVSITGSVYTTGQKIPSWAKKMGHMVHKVDDDKKQALLGYPNGINSWVRLEDLEKD